MSDGPFVRGEAGGGIGGGTQGVAATSAAVVTCDSRHFFLITVITPAEGSHKTKRKFPVRKRRTRRDSVMVGGQVGPATWLPDIGYLYGTLFQSILK